MWGRGTNVGVRMGEVEVEGRGIENIPDGVESLLYLLVEGELSPISELSSSSSTPSPISKLLLHVAPFE